MDRPTARTLLALILGVAALPLGAQVKARDEKATTIEVPPSAYPPDGMCRVWLAGVPAREQPAPTDCATAIRNRPRNATLLFGDLRTKAAQPANAVTAPKSEPRFRGLGNTAPVVPGPASRGVINAGALRTTTAGASVSAPRTDSTRPIRPEKPQ